MIIIPNRYKLMEILNFKKEREKKRKKIEKSEKKGNG